MNLDEKTVADFGKEWKKFDHSTMFKEEEKIMFNDYFSIFPWFKISNNSIGLDLGCGSGRWAKFVAPKIGLLYCIDASPEALGVCKKNLSIHSNCRFIASSVDNLPLPNNFADFAYSLGVLHHTPNTLENLKSCVSKLKIGAPFLIYLYYAFDNRSVYYKLLWKFSDILRKIISRFPFNIKYWISQAIALFIYLPFSKIALLLDKMGVNATFFPLSYYSKKSFYILRNDALDRFGTRLEKRFTKKQIEFMMREAGLKNIEFSDLPPYWVAVGYKE